MKKEINELTIGEAKKELESCKLRHAELSELFNTPTLQDVSPVNNESDDHGVCICVLNNGFMYIGYLSVGPKYFTITMPQNIRSYDSGNGLLWHAENGSKDMTLDSYSGEIKGFNSELKHFIPTKESLWY